MKNTITPDLILEASELASKAGKLEGQIIQRIHNIMVSCFKLFKVKNAYWYFYGAAEGEQGDLWRHYNKNDISLVVDNCSDEMVIVLNNGGEWGLNEGIPTRWLFEDFEEELVSGKKKYEEKIAAAKEANKQNRLKQKEEDKLLATAAKKKLSKQELAALKRSL